MARATALRLTTAVVALMCAACAREPGPSLAELERTARLGESLRGIDLRGRRLEGARLENADLAGSDLRGASLPRAMLGGAHLEGALLVEADLVQADLDHTDLRGAMLQATDLRAATLRAADLGRANLERADLSGADLSAASLAGAYLWSARLRSTDLRGADLRGVDLRRVDLGDADLSTATNLTQQQLDQSCSNGGLRLPPGLRTPRPCDARPSAPPAASPGRAGIGVRGRIQCGELGPCTGERFLVFTDYGGKIIQVTDADDATRSEIERHLHQGAEVVLHGIDPARIAQHRYFVPAEKIVFLD